MVLDYLKEESSADPEIKEKVQQILDKGPKNSEDGKFIAQHCNLKIFEEINLFHDKFEFVKIVFDHFLEISEKTDLQKNIFPKYWSDCEGSFHSDFIEKEKCSSKDFAENLYKNFDYILDNLKISNNKKFDIMETIFYSIALSDYSEFEFYFLEIFLNLCKNKYKFSQKSLETLSKIYIDEIEESFVGGETYIYDISKYDLETIENMIKTCKKYEIPQKIFKINTTAPIVDYFFKNCSDKIYNS